MASMKLSQLSIQYYSTSPGYINQELCAHFRIEPDHAAHLRIRLVPRLNLGLGRGKLLRVHAASRAHAAVIEAVGVDIAVSIDIRIRFIIAVRVAPPFGSGQELLRLDAERRCTGGRLRAAQRLRRQQRFRLLAIERKAHPVHEAVGFPAPCAKQRLLLMRRKASSRKSTSR